MNRPTITRVLEAAKKLNNQSKLIEPQEYIMSEEQADSVNEIIEKALTPKSESISKTMLKVLRRLTKEQLVERLIATSNYAESQKASNMVLLYQVGELNKALNLKKQTTETSSTGETTNEGT